MYTNFKSACVCVTIVSYFKQKLKNIQYIYSA